MGDDQRQRKPRSRADTGRKALPWRRDPYILARLAEVERRHLAGASNYAIAAELGLDESTIRLDLKRLNELWLESVASTQQALRAAKLRELEDIKRRAIAAAEFDERAERAILYGEDAAGERVSVRRDDKGGAKFTGAKAQALNVARQAVMDAAKLLGLVIERVDVAAGVRDEVKRLAAELDLDEAEVMAEADKILKAARAR